MAKKSPCVCGELFKQTAAAKGCEIAVSTLPPFVSNSYIDWMRVLLAQRKRCSAGIGSCTGQIARWAREQAQEESQ